MPKLSLIIPTRERAHTLRYSLQSALSDTNSDVEIIVSDNASGDETRDVVDSFNDARLRYLNPGTRLRMSEHWEFAVSHATGDFVTIIGDDDAVSRDGYALLFGAMAEHPAKVYCWPTHVYLWPRAGHPASIEYIAPVRDAHEVDLPSLVRRALSLGIFNYAPLPHLYHSAVHRDVLGMIKSRVGSYFKTTQPDVFMSFAIPSFSSKAINLGRSVTINGHSALSNSGAALIKGVESTELDRFTKENEGYQLHQNLPKGIDVRIAYILDTLYVSRDLFPELYSTTPLNREAMWAFVESVLREKLPMSVLSHWKDIKSSDPDVRIYKYLAYALLFRANRIRASLKPKSSTVGPEDIFQFSQEH